MSKDTDEPVFEQCLFLGGPMNDKYRLLPVGVRVWHVPIREPFISFATSLDVDMSSKTWCKRGIYLKTDPGVLRWAGIDE